MIRGFDPSSPLPDEFGPAPKESTSAGSAKVVVAIDTQDLDDVVIVGVNANDRPGLLLDISRGLHSLGLQLHHTEASVVLNRSISIWRCALIDEHGTADAEEMQAVLRVSTLFNFLYCIYCCWELTILFETLLRICSKKVGLEQQNVGDSVSFEHWLQINLDFVAKLWKI